MSDDEYDSPEGLQTLANPASAPARQHTPSHRKGPRFSWTPAYEATFFRSLCESVKLGLKDNHSFKSEAWDRACQALADRHGAYPNKSHLINKSDNARKKFRLWRGLREDPEFLYNPNTKSVTASDDAWRAHVEREPLSKSLRNRPFEHEEYMEILFPDVIGSGGAPKRITKPRRKGTDAMPDADDIDAPATNVLNLLSAENTQAMFQPAPSQTPILPPTVPSNGTIRPTSTAMPVRTSIASSSALTPPDEDIPSASHPRKRYLASASGGAHAPNAGEKRRRTGNGNQNYIDLTHPAQVANMNGHQQQPAPAANHNNTQPIQNAQGASHGNGVAHNTTTTTTTTGTSRNHQFQDAMIALAENVRAARFTAAAAAPAPAPPRWPEQAMEIFFRDFGNEDPDLQIKIGEKVLCDQNKATMFCVMPEELRKHWVKRLREVHNRFDSAAGLNANNNNNNNNNNNANNNAIANPNAMMNTVNGVGAGMMQMGAPGGGMGRNGSQVG